MNTPEILTFSAPKPALARVEAAPSPTLELAYAYYALNRPDPQQRADELPWLSALYAQNPKLIEAIRGFWPDRPKPGSELFWMVCELGFAREADIERWFAQWPQLPDRAIKHLETSRKPLEPDCDEHTRKEHETIEAWHAQLEFLRLPRNKKRFGELIRALWAHLEPLWNSEGLAAVRRACQVFGSRYQETGSVLDALPAHHFTQFEASAQQIRASQEQGKLFITPLYFASAGGFNFYLEGGHFIGFGLQAELFFEELSTRVESVAATMKALSDPTRLLLLTLISKYAHFAMTVGDFAAQLGVTQPTVSGHLKLLREAKLVSLEKKSTKSYYTVNAEALRQGLASLEQMVLK